MVWEINRESHTRWAVAMSDNNMLHGHNDCNIINNNNDNNSSNYCKFMSCAETLAVE